MQSAAKTVSAYLKELPAERRKVIEAVRAVILKNLPKGYEEIMQYGMISYVVPLSMYPAGYGEKKDVPLPYISLGAQKNYFVLHLLNLYMNPEADEWFRQAYVAAGKKLDMGKGCVRFKKLEDLPLAVIGKVAKLFPAKKWAAHYAATRKK